MRVWDYPKDPVVIGCKACGRRGKYSKARFVELVGGSTQLADALSIVAKDCPKQHKATQILHDRCQVQFADQWWDDV